MVLLVLLITPWRFRYEVVKYREIINDIDTLNIFDIYFQIFWSIIKNLLVASTRAKGVKFSLLKLILYIISNVYNVGNFKVFDHVFRGGLVGIAKEELVFQNLIWVELMELLADVASLEIRGIHVRHNEFGLSLKIRPH